jgi:hypothetical protein
MKTNTRVLNLQSKIILFVTASALALFGVLLFNQSMAGAAPVACDRGDPLVGYNRERWCGFFNNEGWTDGPPLRGGSWNPDGSYTDATAGAPGVPASVDTAQEFVDMILNDYHQGDTRAKTSAEFIILSMLGVEPTAQQTLTKSVSSAQIAEWQARVLALADTSDDGSGTSTGQNGSITWFEQRHLDCNSTNTFYQIQHDDVAPYVVNATNTPNCTNPSFMEDYIVFRDNSNNILLQIRRICMNPAGEIAPLQAAAAVPEDGELGDKIFADNNNNGVFDEGDDPIPGVAVALYQSDESCNTGDPISTATTDQNGNYLFTNLPIISDDGAYARYKVVVTDTNNVLAGYTSTRGAMGVDNNSQDPAGYCITLAFNDRTNYTGDFGYYIDRETLAPTGSSTGIIVGGAILLMAVAGLLWKRGDLVRGQSQ